MCWIKGVLVCEQNVSDESYQDECVSVSVCVVPWSAFREPQCCCWQTPGEEEAPGALAEFQHQRGEELQGDICPWPTGVCVGVPLSDTLYVWECDHRVSMVT